MSLQEQIDNPSELWVDQYRELMLYAKNSGSELGVPYEMYDTTLGLVDELYDFDEKTACEGLQALPLALTVADEMIAFYDNPMVDKRMIWSAVLLHDIGKTTVPKELINQSNEGMTWSDENAEVMSRHAVNGARIAEANGLPQVVWRAIAEHHGKQLSRRCYGENPELAYIERTTRDCLAVADFIDATLNRTNSRNFHMTRDERLEEGYADIQLVFNDYLSGSELSRRIYDKLTLIAS